ncbi:MFS family permease [Microbacterium terrae]|uniref:Inner membrane protein YbjJ n=1 Tax=Microbacterium terrae TaxID=69369 RepID=A0A0M2H461_9MICO|nr:MFS transporter [Microbacterium terrae]KJL38481.1 Inner membrane protein YbjJ [Microbacterium terrae]MBP1078876.1 MFS family permease [Microbacterium terrae]GLJ98276.1 MFS transporter [Microbacterium terrae]
MELELSRTQLAQWRAAIFTIFFVTGLGFASWASRLPAVKADLGINDFEIGVLLFVMGAASIVGLSLANVIVARWGARRGLFATIIVFTIGVVIAGLGVSYSQSFAVTAVGLVFVGLGMSATDVLMNVEAAAAEQATGKTLMPLFHAFFSIGTVVGAGVGIAMAAWGVAVALHLWGIGVLVVVAGLVAVRFIPRREVTHDDDAPAATRSERLAQVLAVWRDPRTYAIGAIMLGMAFAEGSANDWLTIAVVDGHGQTEAMGAVALTVFSVAMTVFRILGGPLVDRLGRVWTLRILAVLAAVGLIMFILAPSLPIAFVGVALWGAGASLGFPLGMSAAADDPTKAAASVSAAATIGYIAFLCGPPVLGWISHQIGILPTLWIIVGLIAMSGLASGAAKPIAGSTVGAGHPRH